MDPAALDAAATDAAVIGRIHSALAAAGVCSSYLAFVVQHLAIPDAAWRWCCGSQCDPCVQRLGLVVDRARAEFCISPPGLPPPGEST